MESREQKNGFYIIWIYWIKKYMHYQKNHTKESLSILLDKYQKNYSLELVQGNNSIQSKIEMIRQHNKNLKWLIYVINPEREIKEMQQMLKDEDEECKNELFSYYMNIKNVYFIYNNQWDSNENRANSTNKKMSTDLQIDNVSQGNNYKSILIHDDRTEGNKSRPQYNNSSIMDKIFHSLEDESSSCRIQSLYEADHLKIQELEMLDKMAEIDGLEIWNCKYKRIPHTFLKIKNEAWKNCLNFPILHPSQPKLLNNYSIMPRIQLLKPNVNKILAFVSYLKLLDKYFPRYSPVIGSIFEINGLPLVFSKEQIGWNNLTNIGVLCYYVANGDETTLNASSVQRWADSNSQSVLGITIKQMNKRYRQKYRLKHNNESKGLVLFDNLDNDGQNIW